MREQIYLNLQKILEGAGYKLENQDHANGFISGLNAQGKVGWFWRMKNQEGTPAELEFAHNYGDKPFKLIFSHGGPDGKDRKKLLGSGDVLEVANWLTKTFEKSKAALVSLEKNAQKERERQAARTAANEASLDKIRASNTGEFDSPYSDRYRIGTIKGDQPYGSMCTCWAPDGANEAAVNVSLYNLPADLAVEIAKLVKEKCNL